MQTTTSSNHIDTPLKAPRIKGFLLILFLVLLDQGTKYLAILYLKGTSGIPLIDQVLTLRYLENRGMAFGLLQNKILFLVLTCMFFFAAIIYLFIKHLQRFITGLCFIPLPWCFPEPWETLLTVFSVGMW